MAEISVIIPVHNSRAFLQEALDSLSGQSFEDFEAIIVDDRSTDDSVEIAAEMTKKDSRFKLVVREKTGGPSAARNIGIDHANGRFIVFLDSDDMLHPESLSRLHEVAVETKAEIVSALFTKEPAFADYNKRPCPKIFSPLDATENALYQKEILFSVWGKIYSMALFRHMRFREGTWYEDIDLNHRMLQEAKSVAFINERLYFYRPNSCSFINTWSKGRLDVLNVTDRIFDDLSRNVPALTKAAADRRFAANFNILGLLYANRIVDNSTEERCLTAIRNHRGMILRNRRSRLKNRVGALLSYFPLPILKAASRMVYGRSFERKSKKTS